MLAEKSSTTFTGQTARHELFGKVWEAPHQKAVVCIIHGFGEHLGRYTHVAEYFNEKNIIFENSYFKNVNSFITLNHLLCNSYHSMYTLRVTTLQ